MGEHSDDRFSRRALLEWSAGSAALAACARAPRREIVPYATQPKELRPGVPRRYATSQTIDGYAMGLVVEAHDGRPTKVEGNPKHPASLGAARAWDQALIASLYDPDRSAGVSGPDGPSTFDAFRAAFALKRLAIVLEPTSSPSIIARVERLRARGAIVSFHAPLARATAWQAARVATGSVLDVELACERARAILSIDDDFLASGRWCVRDARRLVEQRARAGARLYVVEPRRSATGVFADHRLAANARDRAIFARAVFREIAREAANPALRALASRFDADGPVSALAKSCARDLSVVGRAGAVVVGDAEPLEMHLVAHAIAAALGAHGESLVLRPSPVFDAGASASLDFGEAEAVLFCGTNPVYYTHVDLAGRLAAHVGGVIDETARACAWHVPLAHPLESWADMRAPEGTLSIAQPLVEPLRGGVTVAEVLGALLDETDDARAITRRTFAGDDRAWNTALETGVAGGVIDPVTPAIDVAAIARALEGWTLPPARPYEVALHASHAAYDGRFAGNAWLLELPEPTTKLTWGNHAIASSATAKALGAEEGDVVRVAGAHDALSLPIAIDDGTALGVIAIAHGYGRDAEKLARGVGANAFVLSNDEPIVITRTKTRKPPARTQTEFGLHGRTEIVRARNRSEPPLAALEKKRVSLYEKTPTRGPKGWAMVIDLAACTGCSACVVACQAENNIPIVGEEGVRAGRAMHWLRIDRYEDGDRALVQPMLCQHCDEAPCEYVCPVNATVHSPDGLNEMVYNRCVGTRFCSNNCPYKVRRFNWFDYHQDETPFAQLAHNPDVTVRERGVMEKCTFCVQRIRKAEHRAIVEGRDLHRDEVTTACAQTCPTRAIVFGDAEDPGSAVSAARKNVEAYAALGELGTRPRVRYLPKITDEGGR